MSATTFKVTATTQYLQNEILKATFLTKTAFQRKAIDTFLAGDQKINPALKVTKKSDPDYICKEVTEQIYLDDARKEKLMEVAKREHCGITVVLFQCIYDYCILLSDVVDPKIIENIINSNNFDQ